jgi:hypothetical protein
VTVTAPPFAWIDGKSYLVVNFDLEPIDASLPELLRGLLTHQAPRMSCCFVR